MALLQKKTERKIFFKSIGTKVKEIHFCNPNTERWLEIGNDTYIDLEKAFGNFG